MNAAVTLKQLRLEAGLTQQQVADGAGIDRSWYNQIERGKKPLTRAPREKLARFYKISPVELGGDQEEDPQFADLVVRRLEELEELVHRVRELQERVGSLTSRVEELARRLSGESPGSVPSSTEGRPPLRSHSAQ